MGGVAGATNLKKGFQIGERSEPIFCLITHFLHGGGSKIGGPLGPVSAAGGAVFRAGFCSLTFISAIS